MATKVEIEAFLAGVMKTMIPDINPDKPLMLCIRCDSRYTLPLEYEKCNEQLRDYCPNCVIDVSEEHFSRKDRHDN